MTWKITQWPQPLLIHRQLDVVLPLRRIFALIRTCESSSASLVGLMLGMTHTRGLQNISPPKGSLPGQIEEGNRAQPATSGSHVNWSGELPANFSRLYVAGLKFRHPDINAWLFHAVTYEGAQKVIYLITLQ